MSQGFREVLLYACQGQLSVMGAEGCGLAQQDCFTGTAQYELQDLVQVCSTNLHDHQDQKIIELISDYSDVRMWSYCKSLSGKPAAICSCQGQTALLHPRTCFRDDCWC